MTKAKLESYRQLECKADITFQMWQKLEQEKLSFNLPPDGMPKTSNKRPLETVLVKLDTLAYKYYLEHLEALNTLEEIKEFISSLDDALHQNILTLKYVEGYTWEKVARELKYSSDSYLREQHDKILEIQADTGRSDVV